MRLNNLRVNNLRNLKDIAISLDPTLNLLAGSNGSGKTSLLEAVFFLGSGRSFRGVQIDPIINRNESNCLVSGEVMSEKFGVAQLGFQRREDGSRLMRLNGQSQSQASELARHLPTLLLGPDTVELLRGPPPQRRSFINWGVFHVEHSFTELWRQAVRTLRQRNALLRDEASDAELATWTLKLASIGEKIDEQRSAYVERFLPVYTDTYRFLLDLEGVKCAYRRGWDKDKPLIDVLADQVVSDRRRGYTQSGFQRADLRITIGGKPAAQVCSRGEMKMLSWAMVLTQGLLLSTLSQEKPVFLVDDLIAELDAERQTAIAQLLIEQGAQVLVTGTDVGLLKSIWGEKVSMKMFHVEQGKISELETSE